MKVVVAFVVALTLAVCSSAMAVDHSVKMSNDSNASTNVNTPNNAGTSNNANTPNNANKSNNAGTWNNTNKSNNTGTWNNANASHNANTSTQEAMKVSYEGFAAMRAIRAARVAIFNGEPKVATEWLNKAQTELEAAAKNAPMFITTLEASVNGKVVAGDMTVAKANWIPIDNQVSLSDTFVASPKNAEHIKKANGYFKNGRSKEAVEELRLASIDVKCTRALMSLTTTTNCVAQAVKLVGQQKYYEANMVLKTAEDGVVLDSTNLFATPHYKNEKAKEIN